VRAAAVHGDDDADSSVRLAAALCALALTVGSWAQTPCPSTPIPGCPTGAVSPDAVRLCWTHDGKYTDGSAAQLTGFKAYFGQGGNLANFVSISGGSTRDALLTGLSPGFYTFAVSALVGAAESVPSCTVTKQIADVPVPSLGNPTQPPTFTWSFTAPGATWSRSFSFRATAGYVTDAPDTTYVLRADRYPTTRGGVTFGWENDVEARDRSTAVPALAGVHQLAATWGLTNTAFLVDLPSPGRYRVRWALGDQQYPNRAFAELRDGGNPSTLLLAVPDTAVPAGRFLDATLVQRSAANWPAQNVPREFTFATTQARFVLRRPAATASVVSFISFERVP
jgi:hypothetical protein